MKKKILIFIIIIILLILLIPRKALLWDGGSVEYRAILYKVTKIHRLSEQSSTGYEEGLEVKILGITVYNVTKVYVEATPTYAISEVPNVTTSISDISPTGATITIKDENEEEYTYGDWYIIEEEIDGRWQEVTPIIDDYGFNSIGYTVDDNKEITFDLDWNWLYGELPIGSYRIVKDCQNKYIAIPFDIATTE